MADRLTSTYSSMDMPSTSTNPNTYSMDMPSTSTNPNTYYHDVFINHRGPDVKETLATSLYKRLISRNLRPFLDKAELQKGDYIDSQIENAIRTASIHIVIFSPRYAESRWCLDELLLILNKSGDTIIPIFYKVEFSEVRYITNRYAKALSDHKEKGRYDDKTLENWRIALNKASLINGFELKADNEDKNKLLEEEDKLVEEVVECVLKKRRKTPLYVADFPAGLQEKIEDFERSVLWQQQKNDKARVLGIVGLGGVGKTTLAKELFNRKRNHFNKSSFLYDVRETAGRSSLNSLQSKLLKDLTSSTSTVQIDSIEEGIGILRERLSSLHALIILDDVDDASQLRAFLPVANVLHSDSLILVTSRDKNVLTSSAELSIYPLTGLDAQYSRQLFCSHAFLQPHPLVGFENLVDEFCEACDGLPLSLKVFGAHLCGKNDRYWKRELQKLRQKLPNEIMERLKISYDALDEEERKIFLDISCYFIGEDRDRAIRIWDGSGWNGLVGLANLQDRCLVEVDTEKNTIKMHDHLRDLGRQIVDQQKSCGVIPHREWRVMKDIHELWRQYSVITEVRGIRTVYGLKENYELSDEELSAEELSDEELSDEEFSAEELSAEGSSWLKSWCEEVFANCMRKLIDPSPYRLSKLQLVATEGDDLKNILNRVKSPDLIWLRWRDCPDNCLPHWLLNLMKNLRVLEVSGKKLGTLWRTKSQAPRKLRELTIHSSDSPLFEFPKSIGKLKHIEKIVVYSTGIELLPKEFCDLHSLKYLDLSGSQRLKMLPDSFGCLTNLVHLDLSSSSSLQMLPNSFVNLIRLKYLNLDKCSELTISNETFANCRSLEELHLRGTNLQKLPEDMRNLRNLEVLTVGSHSLKELPCSLGHLSRLKHMELVYCRELKSLPDSLGLLTQLSELKIEECRIESLPAEMEKLSNLVKLTVKSCPIRELPLKSGVEGALSRLEYLELQRTEISEICLVEGVCPSLKHLSIDGCYDLVEVGALPPTLIKLSVQKCVKLRKMEGLYNHLTNLQELHIEECKELEELPCLERLISLKTIFLRDFEKVRKMEGLHNLTNLQTLHISGCKELEELPCLERLISLETIYLGGCDKVRKMEGLHNLTNLRKLEIYSCNALEELPCFERLISLETIDLNHCEKVRKMEGLHNLTNLQRLWISGCKELEELTQLHNLTNLQTLVITGCKELEELPCLESLISLKWFVLNDCEKVRKMEGLHNLTNLQELHIEVCEELEELPCLERLISLEKIEVVGCYKVRKMEGLHNLINLQELNIQWCEELEELPCLERLISLKKIWVYNCDKVRKMEGLHNLTNLQELHIEECKELEELPCVERLISLEKIVVVGCYKVRKMEGLHNLTNLQELHISGCKELEELPCFERLISLETILLGGCDKVRKMEGLHNLTNLQELRIWKCKELEELPCLERLISLETIYLGFCDKVRKMEGLHNLTNLQELTILDCKELEELPCLERLISLKTIWVDGCDKVRKMEGLHNLTNLQYLHIEDCKELEELPCLERLISLKKIKVDMCCKLKRIEGLGQLTQLEECSVVVYIDGQPQRQQQLD